MSAQERAQKRWRREHRAKSQEGVAVRRCEICQYKLQRDGTCPYGCTAVVARFRVDHDRAKLLAALQAIREGRNVPGSLSAIATSGGAGD